MYEVSWHFVHSFTSYSHLSGTTFAFVLYHHDNVTHVLESDGQIGAITIRIGCSPTVFSRLGPQRLLSVPKPQTVAPGKEIHIEWGSHRGKPRLGRFVLERAPKCWKIVIPSVSPSKAIMLRNKYNFTQKTLVSLKIPGLFSLCSMYTIMCEYTLVIDGIIYAKLFMHSLCLNMRY